jgi:hypothetical protein
MPSAFNLAGQAHPWLSKVDVRQWLQPDLSLTLHNVWHHNEFRYQKSPALKGGLPSFGVLAVLAVAPSCRMAPRVVPAHKPRLSPGWL